MSQSLQRAFVRNVISAHVHARPALPTPLLDARVLPDVEGSSPQVARALLPVVRKLKFAIQCDALARQVRADGGPHIGASWLERNRSRLPRETERVRLAMCPSTRRVVRFWEGQTIRPSI